MSTIHGYKRTDICPVFCGGQQRVRCFLKLLRPSVMKRGRVLLQRTFSFSDTRWVRAGFRPGKNEHILLERLDEKVVKLPILHSVRSSPSLFRDKQSLAVSRPKAPSRGDTTSIELVLYRQQHRRKRLYGHWYFCTHFWICRPVSCGVYDIVSGTASPPDQLSYTSSTIVTCNTGFGFMWFGRKLVVHFCVVRTDIF